MRIKNNKLPSVLAVVLHGLVKWLARHFAPELLNNKEQAIRAAMEIGEKLKHQRAETQEWRERALSAEQTLRNAKTSLRDAITEHDKNHGTSIGFLW